MLTEAEESLVRTIAYGQTASATDAQGILALVYGEVLAKHIEKYPGMQDVEDALAALSSAQNSTISVYPNPAENEEVTIAFETQSLSNNKQIAIYNYVGHLVTQITLDNGVQNGQVVVPAASFENGFYSVHFLIDDQVVSQKMLAVVH
jgi:hypothetical protein